jgi:HEAT repeat protein
MLSSEQAQERLEAFRDSEQQNDQLKRLRALRGHLSTIGQVLIETGPEWEKIAHHQKKIDQAFTEACERLGKLKANERKRLFAALFPKLSLYIESTWSLFNQHPYQTTYNRRPFRNPSQNLVLARTVWLQRLLITTRGYDQDVAWFAAWAPYLGLGAPDALGYLFAGAIEFGNSVGQEVYEILLASANGIHEIGAMGRHVVRGFLCTSRPEAWEFIERMLLAAQREEGLRQVILESIDEAHPQAFRRFLHLILDHNLSRFSAAIRAFDVWFGLALETVSQKTISDILAQVLSYLENPLAREQAIRLGTAQQAYYALWAASFEDVMVALPLAISLRQSPSVEHRFAATHLLAQMDLVGSFNELLNALDDPDLRVAARAVVPLTSPEYKRSLLEQSDLFERLEHLLARLPHKENTLQSIVWDWLVLKIDKDDLASLLIQSHGSRPMNRLIPYLPIMKPYDRARVAEFLSEVGKKDAQGRQVLFSLVGDPSSYVREKALDALREYILTDNEAKQMESLLTRQAEDLRRGVIRLLFTLPDDKLLLSAQRLLAVKSENQRRAGLELLWESIQADRLPQNCRQIAEEYKNKSSRFESEDHILGKILAEAVEQYSLDDALGLMNPQNCTVPQKPRKGSSLLGKPKTVFLGSGSAIEILKSLDTLILQHRVDAVELVINDTKKTELLGNIQYGFPHPDPSQSFDQNLARLPLKEVWETWWTSRSQTLRDPDGFELLRTLAIIYLFRPKRFLVNQSISEVPDELQGLFDVRCEYKLKFANLVTSILKWMIWLHPCQKEVSFLLDALETSVSSIPDAELVGKKTDEFSISTLSIRQERLTYLQICRWHRSLKPELWTVEHHAKFWAMISWLHEPKPGIQGDRPHLEDVLLAYQAGAATRDDLLDMLLGPRILRKYWNAFTELSLLSGRKPHLYIKQCPILQELVDSCRERIISIEIQRGDLPTAATEPARILRSVPGMVNLFRLLNALGKTDFMRFPAGQSRQAVLSHLIQVTYPTALDTQEGFIDLARAASISQRRLVELAVFAPQWSQFVEATLEWPKLREAVFWVYAHTKDRQWLVEKEIRELWNSQVSVYTPLTADSLMDGAVDVGWFHQVYGALGEGRWKEVYRAAELTAVGNGHMRARVFADAMLGKVTSAELIERITGKRHPDSVRALGLVPLPDDENRLLEVHRRFEVMQEFLRSSKKYGSQRQASEKLAVAIGMENLARTGGYPDPQRLIWAMEVSAIADLADGPLVHEVDGVRVSLSIDDLGEPKLAVEKNGKALKSIPSSIKKDVRISSLTERKQTITRQASRMRQSLESAMCRGDDFTPTEIIALFQHPILRLMIEQLIFVHKSGLGYPVDGGRALYVHSGQTILLSPEENLRIAHPVDLLETGNWHLWQRECFIAERIQPFKQVFRELYLLTSTEKMDGNLSRRYAGQQIHPRQALSLFGSRGWVVDPEEGIHKTFHHLGISARVDFLNGVFTPAEVECLTLESVFFTRRGEWSPILLGQVPSRIFSEVMRDLDLVVSVAHAGGVDPEASASSIEARSALIQETCSMLHIPNVEIKNNHALVAGKLGNYTIHLGSAVVHKQPGGALCIIPVHSQHRGRLFLPFIDNDPKTAEIISKVILLAKDNEVKDPTILEQIL